MARDAFETDVGGELRDQYGRPEMVLVPKHALVGANDTQRGYQPADPDGRPQVVLLDASGNDLGYALVVAVPAKGDAVTISDASISAGSNVLTSAGQLTFTGRHVGMAVVIPSAGPNVLPGAVGGSVPGVLAGYIGRVANGTALLFTTPAATTALTASTSVSGGTAKIGTDDTAAVQTAINSASVMASLIGAGNGYGLVQLAPNRAYMLGSITAKNNVMVWMYGATIHLITGNSTALNNSMLFAVPPNVSVSNFHLRGGYFPGNGTEAGSSGSQGIIYWHNAAFGGTGVATYTDITVADATVTNWSTGVWDIRGGQRIRIQHNACRSCSTYTGTNTINIILGGGASPVPSNDVFITDNFTDNNGAESIAIGEATNPSNTFDRAVITGNIVQSIGNAAVIDAEWSTLTTGNAKDILIANNVIRSNGANGWGISATSINMPANPVVEDQIQITNNIINSNDGGINCSAHDADVSHNIVNAGVVTHQGIEILNPTTLSVTADLSSSTTLNNVVVAASGVAENGMQITGTGITNGTFLVSGAGTATWTISQAATATTTGQALTGWPTVRRMRLSDNIVLVPNTYARNPIYVLAARDSKILDNIVHVTSPGATGTGVTAIGLYVQLGGWNEIRGNRVNWSAQDGIRVQQFNDTTIEGNRVYNPSQQASGAGSGITLSQASGLPFRVRDNVIHDDMSVHQMAFGINLASTNTLAMATDNDIRGAVTAPASAIAGFLLWRNNTTDSPTFPAATSGVAPGASPYTTPAVPYPSMVAVVGGTVTTVQHNRTGSLARNLASYGGAAANVTAYLMSGDTVTVTYTVAPTVNIFPMA